MHYILQDLQINKETSLKSRLTLLMFRLNHPLGNLPSFLKFIPTFYRFFYQVVIEWILGIEIPWDTQIGKNLQLQHGHGLVINHKTKIGENCILRNSTTIGNKKFADGSFSGAPKIGNNVDIGANVVIIGSVSIGNNAVIGAGSVVVKDVPEGAVVVGNPARVIRQVNTPSSFIEPERVHG
jgi:putative colanic acid biosynthesis acetyltransferase WcaB